MDLTGILLISGSAFVVIVLLAVVLGPMFGWRIAAKHEEFVAFNSDSAPREKIREAFRDLGWTLEGEAPDGMIARTRVNWRSWGEIVSLEFRERGAAVRSECSFPSQAVDYGRNRMNVRSLIEALRKKNAQPVATAQRAHGACDFGQSMCARSGVVIRKKPSPREGAWLSFDVGQDMTRKIRITLIAAMGVAAVAAAYVARRSFDRHLNAEVWYSMSPSTRQELTELILRRVMEHPSERAAPHEFYLVLDSAVDWEKAAATISHVEGISLKRATFGQEVPSGARGLGINVIPFDSRKTFVAVSWSPGHESMMFTVEQKWWRWEIVEEKVTTAI